MLYISPSSISFFLPFPLIFALLRYIQEEKERPGYREQTLFGPILLMNKYPTVYRKRGRQKGGQRLIHVCLQASVYIYLHEKGDSWKKEERILWFPLVFGKHTVFFSVSLLEDARCGAPLKFEKAKRMGVF